MGGRSGDDKLQHRRYNIKQAKRVQITLPIGDSPASRKLFWPAEFLTVDIPEARLWTYGYKADVIGGLFQANNQNSISQHGRDLADPTLFVVHSLGGIIVKDAMHRSELCRSRTGAIVFLGTPHRGSSYAGWGEIAANLARLGLQDSNKKIIETLEVNSEVLDNIHDEFKTIVYKSNIRVHSFQEARGMSGMKGLHKMVVDSFSSKLDLTQDVETVESIDADHMQMVRCSDRKDPKYRAILGVLRHLIRSMTLSVATPTPLEALERTIQAEGDVCLNSSTVTNPAHMSLALCPARTAISRCQTFKRRYVVPPEISPTYTQRHNLSKLLAEKIEISHENASVPHAVMIHGLGGSGKSQLALKFAEDHQDKYEPVLWIDATDVDSTQASFEKCAEELGIRFDLTETKGAHWTHSKGIQALLHWLRDRKETDEEWLVIIDNADDVSWGLKKVIPRAKRGSIIITSRDNLSRRLIDGDCEQLEVDVMSPLEARALLLKCLQWDMDSARDRVQSCDAVAGRLGHLALAVSLAGAYISNEPNQETALIQYIEDFDKHQDDMLQDDRFRGLLPTEKTVWTVWNTTFEKLEKDYARFLPTVLLAFLATFKGHIIQDEIFRLASLGVAKVDRELEEEKLLPSDIRQFLRVSSAGWDDFLYRQSRDLLVRYNLVQRVERDWPGVTMHSLFRWRAMQYMKDKPWEWWYLILLLAACHHLTQEYESLQFRQHLIQHLPEEVETWLNRNNLAESTRLFIRRSFSRIHYARQVELSHIHGALASADGRGIVILLGTSGVGKTNLAATYVEFHKADYSDIFWLDSSSQDSAKMSYAKIARQIMQKDLVNQLSANNADNDDKVVTAVKRWLDHPRNTRWLMIYDNYRNPAAGGVLPLLPDANHGSIIITTRQASIQMGCRVRVDRLDILDSLQILSDASRRKVVIEDPAAAELVNMLDGHPLALSMAGAHIDRTGISIADFLRLYIQPMLRYRGIGTGVSLCSGRTIYSTIQLSFEQVKRESQLSAQLLQHWAYFDNQDLWFELLQQGSSSGPNWFCQMMKDEPSFIQAVTVLEEYGFLQSQKSDVESDGYSIHSALHWWTVHVLNEELNSEMVGLALECVSKHIPTRNSPNSWAIQQRLFPHAARCWSLIEGETVDNSSRTWALNRLGYLYIQQGKYGDANEIFQRALRGKERAVGIDDTSTLDTVNSLGALYADQGRLKEAEAMYERALQGYELALGTRHILTLNIVSNIGRLYADQGRLKEAEAMYERALQGYENALGCDQYRMYIPALNAIENLADLYYHRNRASEAKALYENCQEGLKIVFGMQHDRYRNIAQRILSLH
ncbi:hypothetical protein QQS21_010333 [Conoideocrella luteorostrata]|uniref:AAA+ ATPase domain-containing protein n=1 Tax=Conoideocrella luteorostrata TaxID=1105319 RepID=A0AAJ0CFC0_9HYPO|nr:hypothetical protein QQS21_010333 [Conoideocrella luteorostrata]